MVYIRVYFLSGPNDRVFVFFADHGAPGLIGFPSSVVCICVSVRFCITVLVFMHKIMSIFYS